MQTKAIHTLVPLMASVAALLTGCTANSTNSTNAAAIGRSNLPAAVEGALPQNIAGPPETLSIPHQKMPAVIMATRDGANIHITSRAHWHGKTVTLYYLPANNVFHHGERYEIRSAKNVQKIATVPIGHDGSWSTTWNSGNQVPRHRVFFILAKSDGGEYALIQINTIN